LSGIADIVASIAVAKYKKYARLPTNLTADFKKTEAFRQIDESNGSRLNVLY